MKPAGVVHANRFAAHASAAHSRDVHKGARTRSEPQKRPSALVAEQSVTATGEDGSHPPCASHEPGMTDGIHASMDAVKTTKREAALDRSAAEAQFEQLPVRDNAVLAGRESRRGPVTWPI
jgi:hypothetical protein